MGRRGPGADPTKVKRLRGETRPSRLNPHEPMPSADVPRLPADIDPEAKAVWRRVLRDMRHTGVIRAADADVLRCYCEAVSRYAAAARLYAQTGTAEARRRPRREPAPPGRPRQRRRGPPVRPRARLSPIGSGRLRIEPERARSMRSRPTSVSGHGSGWSAMWAEPWSLMPSVAAPTSPRTASATSATPRAAGPAGPSSTRTGSASSGGRPSSSTRATGLRIYNEVGLGIPRKNTKSTMASAAGLYMLDADSEPKPEVYVAAAARNQAGIVLGQARSMVGRSPLLLDRLVPHRYVIEVPAQRRDHALAVVRRCPPAWPQALGQHRRRAPRAQERRALHRAHDRHRRPRAALHALDHHGWRGRRGDPRRAVRVDVHRIRRARGSRLAAHLPRPRQRDAHLLVRRAARRGHRGPRGLVRGEPGLLAPRRQVPGRPIRAASGPRRAPRVAPLPPQPVRRLRGRLAP